MSPLRDAPDLAGSLRRTAARNRTRASALLAEVGGLGDQDTPLIVDGTCQFQWNGHALDGASGPIAGATSARSFILVLPDREGFPAAALLPANHAGLVLEPIDIPELQEAGFGRVRLETCRITDERRSLPPALRPKLQLAAAEHALDVLSAVLDLALAALPLTGRFAAERGLLDHQVVRHELADVTACLCMTQALLDQCNRSAASGKAPPGSQLAQLAALTARTCSDVIDRCLQIFGGLGYMRSERIGQAYLQSRSLATILGASVWPGPRDALLPYEVSDAPHVLIQFKQGVSDFVARHVTPHLDDWERSGKTPRSLFADFAAAGYLGVVVPASMGGMGLDIRFSIALLESFMDWRTSGVGIGLILASNTVCPAIARHASPALRAELLPGILAGNLIPCMAITEAGGSSGLVHTLSTSAQDEGDHWLIEGEKVFITNGPIADVALVLARTGRPGSALGLTLVAVPTETRGFTVEETYTKLGLHLSATGRLRLDKCKVPKRFTLGAISNGLAYFNEAIMEERLLIAAGSIAFAMSCLRETFKRVDGPSSGVLCAHAAHLHACRAYCWSVANKLVGQQATAECLIAKFSGCDAARQAVECCARLLDGTEHRAWAHRIQCDARVLTIFAGASGVMRDAYATRLANNYRAVGLEAGGLT